MPELVEQMYCSQQIVIPPKFPYVLKRFAKAAIKTQPHDLLEWSYHYFKALAEGTPPPVKLRLEYPVYSTEGGLTRGYLKVLANQLSGIDPVPLYYVRRAWRGSCLDSAELKRVLCMCGVHMREPAVPRLHFLAVAGGLLTKSLTHTMILLCETLTSEPEGGSAAIPVTDFLEMYHFLAAIDASQDCKYIDGYMEGDSPGSESLIEEEGEMMHSEELDESEQLREMNASASLQDATQDQAMVAGRQMSTTSAEFIVASVEREIMDYINEQIAILPDPDLKKKKAKPEEVEMIRDLLERFLEDNMDVIVPEIEEEEEEEAPIPDITKVFEVPGIGPPVDEEIVREFTEYALEVSKLQADCFMPRNIRHFLCPPLEKYIDIQYDKKEEVPTCGVIVD